MEAPTPRYIITRSIFMIGVVIVAIYATSFIKKKQRESAIIRELKSLASDSSFFQQFYAVDARRSMIKAIALMAEADRLGVTPNQAVDGALGIERKYFTTDEDRKEPPTRSKIIRACLIANLENFKKLGYTADFHTIQAMKDGTLPEIPSGPAAGKLPEIGTIIDPAISPGMERVLANLELRPTREKAPTSDVEIAAARQLARDLADAMIIEEVAKNRILDQLDPAAPLRK